MEMHPGQLSLSVGQVARLVAAQFPAWSGRPVRAVASAGTVNALFRVGDTLVARFPLLGDDPDAVRRDLEREAARTAELAASTAVPVPRPVALGEPGEGYPLPWSVQTWLEGVDAFVDDPGDSTGFARDLAAFVGELRAVDTRGRSFDGGGRGGLLPAHDAWVESCFQASGELVDVPRLRRLWEAWRVLPPSGPDVMSHGDLIPGNVLVRDGRLAGVLDGGGFQAADPALDLVGAWHLLESGPREVFRDAVGSAELEWTRGKAWALEQAIGAGWYYHRTNPVMSRMAVRTLERLLADTPS
ncbi:MAG: aminoglycoside phosphotransferase family protein [Actinobacteria bacterium]|nr:aminoglycoside phosphotransferase family protein [Actinomycetota bacterium]